MPSKDKDELISEFRGGIKKFFYEYILIEIPKKIECWVAGGSLRDFFLYGYIKGESDIDIFTTNQGNFDKIVKGLSEFYNIKQDSSTAITFTDKDDEEKVVQVIKKFSDSPQECISKFDLTCCCAYVSIVGDEDNTVIFDAAKEFYDDNYDKTLRFVKLSDNPSCTLGRIQKYKKKGYNVTDYELLEVIKCYLAGETNFDELTNEYNGLKLKSSG